jgi:hypothetical protein
MMSNTCSRVGETEVSWIGLRQLKLVWGCIGDWRRAVLTLVLVNVKEVLTTSIALPAWQFCKVSLVLLASLRLRRIKSDAVHLIQLFHLNTEAHNTGSSVSPYHGSCL